MSVGTCNLGNRGRVRPTVGAGASACPHLAPQHVRDLHAVVVDDAGKVVGGEAVRLQQYLVVDGRVGKLHRSVHHITHHGGTGLWNLNVGTRQMCMGDSDWEWKLGVNKN